ncbi:MAG: hypothetical protein OEO82_08350 [Gammaproteobacteria bacterium]|nr:hypothetical protein [Gammaproteobacteria bacterium]
MKIIDRRTLSRWGLATLLLGISAAVCSQEPGAEPGSLRPEPASSLVERDLVSYPADFFDRFQPITALDMVSQVPGFQLDDAINDVRGFANVAGNVLIDDRRPSTKRDTLTDILSRIPASTVARIELIRGQVRNIDLRGQSTVVNLILREGMPAAVQWEAGFRQTFGHGTIVPNGSISLSDSWRGIDFNTGLNGRKTSVGRTGTEIIFDSLDDTLETRFDDRGNRNSFVDANLNAGFWWGENFLTLNTNLHYEKRRLFTDSRRVTTATGEEQDVFFDDNEEQPAYELGMDIERNVSPALVAKGILLGVTADKEFRNSQTDTDSAGNRTLFRESSGRLDTEEIIARAEFDWSGWSNHLVQANIERAYNALDSSLVQTDDTGAGPVVIDVPGANSKVKEVRWDFLLKDTWILGRFELDYGLGAEASTITQTGDTDLERDFFFVKPQLALNYSSVNSSQTRLSLAREVAQLNLEDFVSATEFVDNDVALGNPNIEPDATWKLELSQEKRLGVHGSVKLTLFHDWISDVLDLLPLTPTFEAPGNIGDGRRWGILWESTLPLDRLGLTEAKLDFKFRWQDSTVTDPVTGADRVLSVTSRSQGPIMFDVDNEYAYEIDYRQDLQDQRLAWGFGIAERGEQLQFKVNEFESYDEGTEFRAFIETTRWFGIKIRIDAENLVDFADTRDRRIFVGERDLTPLESRQFRDRTRGRRLQLSFSGSF